MIYDPNCPRCRLKLKVYFCKTNNIKELAKLLLEDDKLIYDRLAEI